jgi:broad specificity phosphatase PhoE
VQDADLVEWNYGAYEGLTTTEIQTRVPGWLVFRDGCPGGESPVQVGKRVDRVIARLRGGPGPSLVVALGHLLRVLLERGVALMHYSLSKMAFQSCFMSTTTQPRLGASRRASTSLPVLFGLAS